MKKIMMLTLLITPAISYAIFCPTNFNQINFGDSIEKVQQQCGKPDKQETKEVEDNTPQEWSYYVPQTVSMNTMAQAEGTLKTQITFDENGKAINISVNGIGVGSTTICGTTIQLGDSRDKVKTACGKPAFVNKQSPSPDEKQQVTKMTEFTYNTTPPVKLVFENGKLTERK